MFFVTAMLLVLKLNCIKDVVMRFVQLSVIVRMNKLQAAYILSLCLKSSRKTYVSLKLFK